jgi:hypothetical protein
VPSNTNDCKALGHVLSPHVAYQPGSQSIDRIISLMHGVDGAWLLPDILAHVCFQLEDTKAELQSTEQQLERVSAEKAALQESSEADRAALVADLEAIREVLATKSSRLAHLEGAACKFDTLHSTVQLPAAILCICWQQACQQRTQLDTLHPQAASLTHCTRRGV